MDERRVARRIAWHATWIVLMLICVTIQLARDSWTASLGIVGLFFYALALADDLAKARGRV